MGPATSRRILGASSGQMARTCACSSSGAWPHRRRNNRRVSTGSTMSGSREAAVGWSCASRCVRGAPAPAGWCPADHHWHVVPSWRARLSDDENRVRRSETPAHTRAIAASVISGGGKLQAVNWLVPISATFGPNATNLGQTLARLGQISTKIPANSAQVGQTGCFWPKGRWPSLANLAAISAIHLSRMGPSLRAIAVKVGRLRPNRGRTHRVCLTKVGPTPTGGCVRFRPRLGRCPALPGRSRTKWGTPWEARPRARRPYRRAPGTRVPTSAPAQMSAPVAPSSVRSPCVPIWEGCFRVRRFSGGPTTCLVMGGPRVTPEHLKPNNWAWRGR